MRRENPLRQPPQKCKNLKMKQHVGYLIDNTSPQWPQEPSENAQSKVNTGSAHRGNGSEEKAPSNEARTAKKKRQTTVNTEDILPTSEYGERKIALMNDLN